MSEQPDKPVGAEAESLVESASVDLGAPAAAPAAVPSDSLFATQWHLHNTGQYGGLPGIDINVLGVWDDYTGQGVRVGVIDDGIEYGHADLDGNYATAWQYDYGGNDGDPHPSGTDYHGTAVAGLIAAENDGVGTVGVAYNASVTGFRIFGGDVTIGEFADVFRRQAHFDVSNNSWGYSGFFYDNFDSTFAAVGAAIEEAVTEGRGGRGTSILFAAGNGRSEGQDANYHSFSNARETIAVAAVTDLGEVSWYSTPGAPILVSGPSNGGRAGIATTDRTGSTGYASGDYTGNFGGTSAAAPIVSGVVALMYEANPELGYRDVQQILAYSARMVDAGDAGWDWNGAHDWNGGGLHVSHDFGYGLVDAHAAVRLAETWDLFSNRLNEVSVSAGAAPWAAIPDTGTLVQTVNIAQGIEIDHVELSVDIRHTWIGDLTVRLISPAGTESVLVNRPGKTASNIWGTSQDNIIFTLSSTHHWGETGEGTWTILVSDSYPSDAGTLRSFTLTLYGDVLDADDLYVFTDEYGGFTGAADAGRRLLADEGGFDTLNGAALTGNAVIDLRDGGVGTIAGNAFALAAGTVIERAYGGDGDDRIWANDAGGELFGGRGSDVLFGGAGADLLSGGPGDDTLAGGAGDDLLYGGEGEDVALFLLDPVHYAVDVDGAGGASVSGRTDAGRAADGADTLFGIEWLAFGDGSVFDLAATEHFQVADLDLSIAEDTELQGWLGAFGFQALWLTAVVDRQAASGTLSLDADGTFVYRPAAGFAGTDSFEYSLASRFGAAQTGTVTISVEAVADAPSLSVPDVSGRAGTWIALPIEASLSPGGGTEVLSVELGGLPKGVELSAGRLGEDGIWRLTAAELPGLALRGSDGAGQIDAWVRATATEPTNGDAASVTAALAVNLMQPNSAPQVLPAAHSPQVALGTAVPISSLIGASDPDGDPIQRYQFWELRDAVDNGTLRYAGVAVPDQTYLTVAAADLDLVDYAAGSVAGYDTLYVRANDGQGWGAWAVFWPTSYQPNRAPEVVAYDSYAPIPMGGAVAMSDLIRATDADGDRIVRYQFWELRDGTENGTLRYAGEAVSAQTYLTVSAADLAKVDYAGGAVAGYDALYVRADDGQGWGKWTVFWPTTVTTNEAPVVTRAFDSIIMAPGASVPLSLLFTATDAEGDPIRTYHFWDATANAGSGHVVSGGIAQPSLANISIAAEALADSRYVAGPAGSETLYARAADDYAWGRWTVDWPTVRPAGAALAGGSGDDLLVGGAGDDRFVFRENHGHDSIYGFETGEGSQDRIDLSAMSDARSFEQAMALARQDGADTVLDFGPAGSLTLLGVDLGDLHRDDFLF